MFSARSILFLIALSFGLQNYAMEDQGLTAVDFAKIAKNLELVGILERALQKELFGPASSGREDEQKSDYLLTPLMCTQPEFHEDIHLPPDESINIQTKNGTTPLMPAEQHEQESNESTGQHEQNVPMAVDQPQPEQKKDSDVAAKSFEQSDDCTIQGEKIGPTAKKPSIEKEEMQADSLLQELVEQSFARGQLFAIVQCAPQADNTKHAVKLLAEGVDPNSVGENGANLLLMAAVSNNRDVAALLIDNGADIDKADSFGITPLMRSIDYGFFSHSLFCFLVARGADLDLQDNEGKTALRWAITSHNNFAACYLIEKGANVNRADKHGQTPLMSAAVKEQNQELIKLLLSAGVDVNSRSGRGHTALTMAREREIHVDRSDRKLMKKIIKLLIAYGAEE